MMLDFQNIYDEFYEKIHFYLCRLVGSAEAEDLTQEVFVKVNQNLAGFEGKSSLSTWIYRIATHTAMDMIRSKAHRQDQNTMSFTEMENDSEGVLPGDVEIDKKALSADRNAIRAEMTECIREFIGRLSADYQTVIVLAELKELKNQEIADILNISLHTVKIRLHRARAKLRQEFEAGCNFYRDEDNRLSCDRKKS